MMRRVIPRLALGTSGVAAIEFVIVFPLFLTLVFAIIESGRLMWQQVSMQRAVATAARCGALGTMGCVSNTDIINTAIKASALSGLTIAEVTPDQTASCGVKVTATRKFTFILRVRGVPEINLTAQACHPILR